MMKQLISALPLFVLLLLLISFCVNAVFANLEEVGNVGTFVRKEKRETIAEIEDGRISGVDIHDGIKGRYHLQFITLEPNSLFLPVLLHADMVFIVQTGSGSLSWADEEANKNHMDVKRGDIYRLQSGSVFFIKSSLESAREKLRFCAIFTDENPHQLYSEPYSTLTDLITGFDRKVLQAAFQVPEEVIYSITRKSKPPPIVHSPSTNKTGHSDWTDRIFEVLTGAGTQTFNSKKRKTKTESFNILDSKPDFENCNGWSKTVNRKELRALKGSNIGVFMVNLTQGSMMGPHWNPRASEIAIVMHGQGMVRVVCSSLANASECKNRRFRVKEGDVFAIPRFHPMAQMAYNNDTFVFMGFSTMASRNYPQFLAGKSSVLQTLDKDILAMSFNVPNSTIDQLLSSQADSIILSCVSCAEEEEQRMQEEIERQTQEEARRKEEEEAAKRREEEEARRREEEARKREEEEARKREEEAARKREEEVEEEEARKREEEATKEEEETAREREAAEERKREEEARREQEEAQRREEERRSEEERQRREEEEARRQEEEREESRREEEEARRQEEGREESRREEEEARRQEEERQERREEEESRRQEEEREREEEEEEERRGREEEEWRGEGGRGSRKIFIF